MKRHFIHAAILSASAFLFIACGADKRKTILNTWKLAEDSAVVLDLKNDSTYTLTDNNITRSGKWELSESGDQLILKKEDDTRNVLDIKEVKPHRLVISNNGEVMTFTDHKP